MIWYNVGLSRRISFAMKIIDTIEIQSGPDKGRIELLFGDLTRIPKRHQVDVLVVSAFPRDYLPTAHSLIGGLFRSGLSVQDLAQRPLADLRENFSCWLSRKFKPPIAGLSFQYVLCFEPETRGTPPEVVSDIFRALAPFTYGKPNIRSIAMPILATGDQGYTAGIMLNSLLTAATNWLAIGFPLKKIKLVAHTKSQLAQARRVFVRFKARGDKRITQPAKRQWESPPRLPKESKVDSRYQVFVSYSREDETSARHFANQLRGREVTVFLDRSEIEVGAVWQQKIFDALECCAMVAAFYSPGFVASAVCKDEFNISWARGREAGQNLIFPLLIRDAALPTYMKMLNYIDCRICDKEKIADAAHKLAQQLAAKTVSNEYPVRANTHNGQPA
jgi:TIR domain